MEERQRRLLNHDAGVNSIVLRDKTLILILRACVRSG
jgi:hypothetical protein